MKVALCHLFYRGYMDIKIEDLQYFEELLTSISKITGACKFSVDKTGCEVKVKSETEAVRAFFNSKSLVSEEPISFCLSDIKKLNRSIKIISDNRKRKMESYVKKKIDSYEKIDDSKITKKELTIKFEHQFKKIEKPFILIYDHPYIKFSKDGIKFKFSTIKEDVIEYTKPTSLTRELTDDYGFTISSKMVSRIAEISSITALDKPKVYIYKEKHDSGEYIVAEVDDKTQKLSDSIGIPITKKFFGDWYGHICLILDAFKLFNLIPSEEIKVAMTKEKAISVKSSNKFNSVHIITQGLKK